MRCEQCGTEVSADAIFCQQCGVRLNAETASKSDPPTAQEQFVAAASRPVPETPDVEIWSGTYATKAMLGPWTGCAALTFLSLVLAIWIGHAWAWWLALVVVLCAWIWSGLALISRRLGVRYRLTSQRFFHETGLLRHVTDRIEVIDIDDVTCEQGIIERILGLGTIRIASSDRTHPQLVITGIENVQSVAGKIDEARLAERKRRGLHIEQI